MPTGGDGTAYYGEEVIDEKVMTKKDIKKRDEIADAISTKDMKDRYGDKNVKYAIATKIVMDKKKKKKEEMKEELDEKDKPFVKKLVKNLKKGSKTHEKQAEKLEKAMKENTAIESELVIQDWNSDDIKFTEIETVDIIKAKPLKEEHSDWRLDEKFSFAKNVGKLKIKGTPPIPKMKSTVKVPKGFTKYGAITPFRTSPLTSIKPTLSKGAFQTPLSIEKNKNKAKEAYKKLMKKYDNTVAKKKSELPKEVKKKFITKPKSPDIVSKDDMIMPKKGEAEKTKKMIDKYKNKQAKEITSPKKGDIEAEKRILDARLDKKGGADARVDDAIKYLTKKGVNLSAKPPKPLSSAQQKGLKRLQKTVDAGRDGMRTRDKTRMFAGKVKDALTSKKVKDAAVAGTVVGGAYALGRKDEKDAQEKKRFKDVGSESPKPSGEDSEVKPHKPIGKPDLKPLTKKKTIMASMIGEQS